MYFSCPICLLQETQKPQISLSNCKNLYEMAERIYTRSIHYYFVYNFYFSVYSL
jgi:hypothetical protein